MSEYKILEHPYGGYYCEVVKDKKAVFGRTRAEVERKIQEWEKENG